MESKCSSPNASTDSDIQPCINDNEQAPPSREVCEQQTSMMSENVPQGIVESKSSGNVQISLGNGVELGTNGNILNRQIGDLVVQLEGNKDVETCQTMNVSRNQTVVNGDQYNFPDPVTFRQNSEKPSIRDVSDSEVAEAGVPPVVYNHMVFQVYSELSEKQFNHMRRLLHSNETGKLGIPTDVISSVKNAEELLDLMAKFKYLGPTNTWFLQYLLYFVGNKSLYKKVFMFTKESLTSSKALIVYEPNKIKGPKQSNVKLKIVGDIHQFRPIDVETFRQMLAKQCGEDIEYVCANGQQEGSIILYFQVPEECKKHLLASCELLTLCRMYGITQICVDEEDMVSLPQLTKEACYNYAAQSDAVLDVLGNCTERDYKSAIQNELKIGGKSLLHLAVELNYLDLVQHLISSGANVADTDQMEATALHLAVFLGHTEICKELLKHKATYVNAVDQFGNTALHVAAYQDDFKLGTLLIDHEASTNVNNQEGQSPISIAKTNNCAPLIHHMTDKKMEDLAVTVDKLILCCPICHGLFKKPRVLPCFHNFCENCLEKQWQLTKGNPESIECSMCKEVSTVPDGDITGFMLNKPLQMQVEEARHILKVEKQKAEQAKQVSDDDFIGGIETLEIRSKDSTTNSLVATSQVCDESSDIVYNKSEQMDVSIEESGETTAATMPDRCKMATTPSMGSGISKIVNNPRNTVSSLMMVTEKSLTCPYCQKRFRNPVRKLNCSHSFCGCCLVEMVTSGKSPGKSYIACHVCNEETDFTEGEDIGLRDLPLNDLVEDAKRSRPDDLNQTDLMISDEGEDWPDYENQEMDTDQIDEKMNEDILAKHQGFGEPASYNKGENSSLNVVGYCDVGTSRWGGLESGKQNTLETDVLGLIPKNHVPENKSILNARFFDAKEESGKASRECSASVRTTMNLPEYAHSHVDQQQKQLGLVTSIHDNSAASDTKRMSAANQQQIPEPKPPKYFEMLVCGYYRQQKVFEVPVLNDKGCLLYHKQPKNHPEEDLSQLTLIEFQEITEQQHGLMALNDHHDTRKVIDVMKKGVVIRERDGVIYATRRCRSKAFVHFSHDIKGDCIELKRNEETRVYDPFLFQKSFCRWLLGHGSYQRPPNIIIIFAQRWNSRSDPLVQSLVYAVVTPMRAHAQLAWGPNDNELDEIHMPEFNDGNNEMSGTQIQHTQELVFPAEDTPSSLYEDQLEVALPSVEGRNTLIQMPTGAGKTVVAAKIIEKVINEADIPLKCKVIFMVPTGPLVKQQQARLEQRLHPKCNFRITGLKGDTQKVPLKETLEVHNVVVLTAAILDNALREGDHLVELDTLALFVFDECHHCMKDHVYNSIMKRYIFEMFEHPDSCKLPQIIALTATTGTGKAKSQVAAEDHVFQLICNLNTPHISVVELHKNTLKERMNVPEEMNPICVDPRAVDPFKTEVCKIMSDIEDIMEQSKAGSLLRELKFIPRDRKSQGYKQWLSRLEKESGEQVGDGDQLRIIRTCVRHLHNYHVSLLINAEVRTKDAYDYLNSMYNEMSEPDQMKAFNDTDFNLLRKFMSKRRAFGEVSRNPKYHNPLLKTLEEIIVREYQQRPKSRALLFCQSVETTKALKTWIEETESLQFLQPNRMVGGKGMTSAQHKEILDKFQDGRHKLLVATNVLEEGIDMAACNLVIRLNYVPSDTGHVQSKGRGRAKGIKCYLIASSECNFAAWELANQARSEMSQRAVDGLRRMPIEELKTRMLARQREDYFQYKMEKQAAQSVRPIHAGEFQLLCGGCRRFACSTIDIGVYNESHHIVLDEQFLMERTKVTPHPKPKRIDHEFSTIGKIHCKECNKDWGILAIICDQTLPMIKIVSFIIEREEENGGTSRYLKEKWIDAKKIFHVNPLKREDLQGLKQMNVSEYYRSVEAYNINKF